MNAVPTMADEALAGGESLSSAEAYALEHEAPLHSCPSCARTTPNGGVCDDCAAPPDCVNCGDHVHDHQGVCDICDPAPLLASLADAHVSPDAIRAAVEAEREECAALIDSISAEYGISFGAAALRDAARQIRSRGRVSIG